MSAPNDVAALVERARNAADNLGRELSANSMLPPELSGVSDTWAEEAAIVLREAATTIAPLQAEVERAKEDSARLDWLSKTISAEVRYDDWEDGSWQVFSAIGNRSDQKWKLLGDREDLRDAIDDARSASRKENTP